MLENVAAQEMVTDQQSGLRRKNSNDIKSLPVDQLIQMQKESWYEKYYRNMVKNKVKKGKVESLKNKKRPKRKRGKIVYEKKNMELI